MSQGVARWRWRSELLSVDSHHARIALRPTPRFVHPSSAGCGIVFVNICYGLFLEHLLHLVAHPLLVCRLVLRLEHLRLEPVAAVHAVPVPPGLDAVAVRSRVNLYTFMRGCGQVRTCLCILFGKKQKLQKGP